MSLLSDHYHAIERQVAETCRHYGRDPSAVTILPVSKTQPIAVLEKALKAGIRLFGENYLQEAAHKIAALPHDIHWHFIGQIQRRKTADLACYFDWVHTIDRALVAERLDQQRPADLPPLNVCIQVNVDNEIGKAGVSFEALPALAAAIVKCSRLALRGLCAIPAPRQDFLAQRAAFARVRDAYVHLNSKGYALDTLSMGMSGDWPAAIAEGATILRLGKAIFGERK